MVHTNRHLMQRAFSIFITFALLAVAIIPVAAQTNRRRSRRAAPRLGTYSRTSRAPIAPRSYAVDADQTIRVRMNDQLNSETARIGQRFTTRVVEPVYSTGGVEVIPAGSTITGASRASHAPDAAAKRARCRCSSSRCKRRTAGLTRLADRSRTFPVKPWNTTTKVK